MQNLSLIRVTPEPLPSADEVIGDINGLLQLLYESLDAGAAVCRQYYEEHCDGDKPSPHLREMLVRDQAKRYLQKNGLRVKELKEQRTLRLATEPLISLLVHHRGYALRVLKGREGMPPGCGTSKKRREFYNQAPVRYLDEQGVRAASQTNLLALWEFDTAFGVANVWLACPQVAGARSQQVVLAWKELIPHPVTQKLADTPPDANGSAEERTEHELESLLLGHKEPNSQGGSAEELLDEPDLHKASDSTLTKAGAYDREPD
jgi:hypothetical protein